MGAKWLCSRILDLSCRFEPHWRHCVVFWSKTHQSLLKVLVQGRKDKTEKLLAGT